MGGDYSERLCDDRHKEISKKFDTLFKKVDWAGLIIGGLIIIGALINVLLQVRN